MRSLGLSINPGGGKPRLTGAVVSGTVHEPKLEQSFELRTTATVPSEQAIDLARLLQAKLPALTFDDASIRTAGAAPVASRHKAQFSRAHAEGAALFVLRENYGGEVAIGDPRFFAKKCGVTKDGLIAKARGVLASKHDAVLAAIAGLPAD